MAVEERETRCATGAALRAARRTRSPDLRVVVRAVPDGGCALARAREHVIARLLSEILRELDGEAPCER